MPLTARILLVEDDLLTAHAVSQVLAARRPWEFVVVRSLAEAIIRLERDGIDLVILDLILPCIQGVKGVTAIKAAHPHVALVVLTGGGSAEPQEVIDAGADAYLEKGEHGQFARLIQAIDLLLEYQSARKQLCDSGVLLDRAAASACRTGDIPTAVACDTAVVEGLSDDDVRRLCADHGMTPQQVRDCEARILRRKRRLP